MSGGACVTCGFKDGMHACVCGFVCEYATALHEHLSSAHLRSGTCRSDPHPRPPAAATVARSLAASAAAYATLMQVEKKKRANEGSPAERSKRRGVVRGERDDSDSDGDSDEIVIENDVAPAAEPAYCSTCGFGDDKHVCTCSREFTRRSILYWHIDNARLTSLCSIDRHRQDAKTDSSVCVICGELLELSATLRTKHAEAHSSGLFWCVFCQKGIPGREAKIERHFAFVHQKAAAPATVPAADGTPPPQIVDTPPPSPPGDDADSPPRDSAMSPPPADASTSPLVQAVAAAAAGVCDICGQGHNRHICMCGSRRIRIGSLIAHIKDRDKCAKDPHLALLERPGACSTCGEPLEADADARARHLQAHQIGESYWCVLCSDVCHGRRFAESHFATYHKNSGETPMKGEGRENKIAAKVATTTKVVSSNGQSRLRGNAATSEAAASPPAPITHRQVVGERAQKRSAFVGRVNVEATVVELNLPPAVPDSGDDGSGADVCAFVSDDDGEVASKDSAANMSKQCRGTRCARASTPCRSCSSVGGAHVCVCGQEFSRVSVLHAHIAWARERGGACERDPHRKQLGRHGACDVCGELLEADDDVREQHVATHKIGLFWCGDCHKPVTMRMAAIEEHYAAETSAENSGALHVADVDDDVDDGGARERLMDVDEQLQVITDMAEQLAVYTSALYGVGEEVRRSLEPVAGALRRNRAYADELLGGVQNFRSADRTPSFIAYAMVPADALVDVRLSHDRSALVLAYECPAIAPGDITSAMPRGLPLHIQQALAHHVSGVVADALSRRAVSLRLRLSHAVNLATFHAWKVFRPNAIKVLFFSGAYDFTEPVVRIGSNAM